MMDRREELNNIFKNVDESERKLVDRLIEEVIFLEDQMTYYKTLPFIKTHPNNPEIQKATPAAKLYKESSQSYMNAIRILVNILRKIENSAADKLMEKLEEFKV